MNKNVLIGIVILVLVVGGGFYLVKGKSTMQTQNTPQNAMSQPTNAPSAGQMAATTAPTSTQMTTGNNVSYTSSGFEPNTITIKAGQTVTWTNKDSGGVWVASNPHPTHTDYPGLDALKVIPSGGTYSFTFTKVGTWGYHNHLNPSQGGTVIVTQ